MSDLTGRKLDAAVVKVRGWEYIRPVYYGYHGTPPEGHPAQGRDGQVIPYYSSDLNTCFKDLVPEMRECRKDMFELVSVGIGTDFERWSAVFVNSGTSRFCEGVHESPATAICLAYLEMKKENE